MLGEFSEIELLLERLTEEAAVILGLR